MFPRISRPVRKDVMAAASMHACDATDSAFCFAKA
jgi:hypothetical protein